MRLFWCKTISGNDFTPQYMFGCAWKIKFSGITFQLTVCFMALTRKLVYISIFSTNHFRVSDAQREREREERVTDPPKTDCTPASAPPPRSHPRPIAPHWDRITIEDRSTQNRSHRRRRYPWPISSLMTRDRSLPFPQFLITLSSSLSQFDRIVEFNQWCCFDFCFFKFIYWNFLL